MNPHRMWLTRLLLSAATTLVYPAVAQTVITPSTGSMASGTTVTNTGTTYTIDGGARSGPNLFHSFDTFDLTTSRTAAWVQTSSDPSSVRAVVNRVIGGTASTISGTINSTALPNATFYFINPAGIVFTAGARVNVGQSAHFSTADSLRFADGRAFAITTTSGSVLSADAPAAFGFLGSQAGISLTGLRSGSTPFSALNISAADIDIKDSSFVSAGLGLFAVGTGAADLPLQGPVASSASAGGIAIDGSLLTIRSDGVSDGSVAVAGNSISLSDGRLVSQSTQTRAAGKAALQSGNVTLTDFLFGSTSQTGFSAGDVSLDSRAVHLSGASRIQADAFQAGNAGNILVRASSVDLSGTSGISARGGRNSQGNAGDVKLLVSGLLSMHDQSEIASRVEFDATGDAGNVEIEAGTLTMVGLANSPDNRAEITSSTRGGAGGDVTISVAGTLTMGVSSDIRSAANSGSIGNAGDVTISAGQIALQTETSRITSSTDAVGNAGIVTVVAGGVTLGNGEISSSTSTTGNAGIVNVTAKTLTMGNGQIASSTISSGIAGIVNVNAETINFNNGSISSTTSGDGIAGRVDVTAETLNFNNGQISSSTSGTGNAGVVNVTATKIAMTKGQISSTTTGSGNAGMVRVSADTIDMGDISVISASAKSGSRGNAGKVVIQAAKLLNLQGSSVISSRTETNTQGDAGDIDITAGQLTMSGRAGTSDKHVRISTSTQSGAGGNVRITVAGLMSQIANADILAGADGLATQDGGTITIKAQELRLLTTSSNIATSTTAPTANAGAVTIEVGTLLLDSGRLLSTTTKGGNAGQISVTANNMTMRGASAVSASTLSGSSGDAGHVVLNIGALDMGGTAEITSRTEFTTLGNAGDIDIIADSISMMGLVSSPNNRAEITSSTRAGAGGNVRIDVAGTLSMGVSSDIRVAANPGSTGDAGTVTIKADRLELLDSTSRITSSTQSVGNAGGVALDVATLLVDGGEISSNTVRATQSQPAAGNAGKINITANSATVRNSGQITTSTDGPGLGGAITVTARQSLDVLANGNITSAALVGSSGDAGTVTIQGGTITIGGAAANATPLNTTPQASLVAGGAGTVSSSTASFGQAGTVTMQGSAIAVHGNVTSSTSAAGQAGSVNITSASLLVDGGAISSDVSIATATGLGGTVLVSSPQIQIINDGIISSSTISASDAGKINVTATSLLLQNGGSVRSSTSSAGNAGSVGIASDQVVLLPGTDIRTSSTGSGRAGAIEMTTARTTVDGAVITSSAENSDVGTSGSITLTATDSAALSNGGIIETTSANSSQAGTVAFTGGSLVIDGQGSRIATENSSTIAGAAGLIRLSGGPITLSNGGTITSNSVAGPAGDINLQIPQDSLLTLTGKHSPGVITTSSGPQTGGRITIEHPLAIISNGGSILAQGQQGGANVQISTGYFIRSSDRLNLLTVNGILTLNTLNNDVSSGIVSDSLSFIDASKVLRGQCAAAASRGASVMRVSPLRPVADPITPSLIAARQSTASAGCL